MNEKIIITILSIAVVTLFITTVYFATTEKTNQPITPKHEIAQPTTSKPIPATQPTAQPETPVAHHTIASPLEKHGTVYTNVEYGFQFTMPQKWMGIIDDFMVTIQKSETDGTPAVIFYAKATDEDWLDYQDPKLPKGFAELFTIGIIKKADWDHDVKTCNKNETMCIHSRTKLGENTSYVFVLWMPHSGPNNFTMFNATEMQKNDPGSIIQSGFKLLEP